MTDVITEQLERESLDIAEDRIAKLREDFPEVFRDGKIDFDTLKRALGEHVEPDNERFGLQWPGKAAAFQAVQTPSVATLLPDLDKSVDWDTTQNLIIEGDNLEVLKLLQKSYYGKVKMIYIDPPYNTGNDFIYPDNYREGLQSYLEFTGQVNAEGKKLATNTESGGRYHSNWLNMMYPRLYLARNLLREDGVIFVSIDDTEVAKLRALMDEVFGEENHFATLTRRAMHTVRNSSKDFNLNADYVVMYGRNKAWYGESPTRYIRKRVDKSSGYTKDDGDGRGPYKLDPLSARNYNKPYKYRFQNGIEWEAPSGSYPRYSIDTLARMEQENRVYFGGAEPRAKRYLAEVQEGQPPDQILSPDDVGFNMHGTSEVAELFGDGGVFSQPKPQKLVGYLSSIVSTVDGDIVLDFFAGSGTTGHAVLKQNADDGASRRFILVQLPEPIEPPKTLDDGRMLSTIADITRERVRRAAQKIAGDNPNVDTGFRAYRLATSNFTPWDGTPPDAKQGKLDLNLPETAKKIARQLEAFTENVVPDRTQEDLLTEILLRLGYDLTVPVERLAISGHTVFAIANGAILACLEPSLTLDLFEELAQRDPGQIVCLDSAFGDNDELKVNAVQVIRSRARSEEATIKLWLV